MSAGAQSSPPVDLDSVWNLGVVEGLAGTHLAPGVRALVNEGAGDSLGVLENCRAWRRWAIRSRVLRDVQVCDTRQTALGVPLSMPILIAPSGLHGLVHTDAETATARAAKSADTMMVLSTSSSLPMEAVAQSGVTWWFQLYWGKDRSHLLGLIERAAAAGCRALCLTLDLPVRPWLHESMRAGLATIADIKPAHGLARRAHLTADSPWDHDSSLTWKDLSWLTGASSLPIVLKGITTAADARLAVEHGVAGIIVSNHGGRALAEGMATAEVLPEIVAAVDGRIEVFVDGGIRSGSDVFKALALGARAVLLGRPVLWGLALWGENGVRRILDIVHGELRSVMGMAGAAGLAQIDRQSVSRRDRE
jgi:4-hydroxymandelate oxidase